MTAIIDYGVGNLFSLRSSFAAIGEDAEVTADPERIRAADRVILPGVGAFGDAAAQKYLEAIMTILSKNGFVDGVHGKGGGYKLNRKPEEYKIGDILRLTEGTLAPVACLVKGAEPCAKAEQCTTLPMWTKLDDMINSYLDSVSIKDLMK